MKTDHELRQEVEKALEREPSADYRQIGVAVKDGVVVLTGDVPYHSQKTAAERVVERVDGVVGIANEIQVAAPTGRTDREIAKMAADALRSPAVVPPGHIEVEVEEGWVTLKGEVHWDFQRRAAERAVRAWAEVRGVSNEITLKPGVAPKDDAGPESHQARHRQDLRE